MESNGMLSAAGSCGYASSEYLLVALFSFLPELTNIPFQPLITFSLIPLNTSYNNKSHGYQTCFRRNINKYTVAEFQNSLSYESWDQDFDGGDVNKICNSFLNTYVRIFYASFPLKKLIMKPRHPR